MYGRGPSGAVSVSPTGAPGRATAAEAVAAAESGPVPAALVADTATRTGRPAGLCSVADVAVVVVTTARLSTTV